MRGRLRLRWFPPVRLNILPPVLLAPPHSEDLTPRQRREVTGRALQDVMVDAVFRSKDTGRSLFTALLDARDAFGPRTIIAEDIERKPIGYDRVVVGSAALGRALAAAAPGETHVALLMPNAIASLVAFMGLQAFGIVPCLLNISAGAAAMLSACRHRRRAYGYLEPRLRGEGTTRQGGGAHVAGGALHLVGGRARYDRAARETACETRCAAGTWSAWRFD